MMTNKKPITKKTVTALVSAALISVLAVPAFASTAENAKNTLSGSIEQEAGSEEYTQTNTTNASDTMQEFKMEDYEGLEDFRGTLLFMLEDGLKDKYNIATYNVGNSKISWEDCDEQYLELLDEVREAMKARDNKITVTYHTEETDIRPTLANSFALKVMYDAMVHNGDPKAGDYLYQCTSNTKYEGDLVENKNAGTDIIATININWYTSKEDEKKIDTEVNRIINSFKWTNATSDYKKISDIYDYITSTVTYDYKHVNDWNDNIRYFPMRTAYGTLIDHTAICQGIAVTVYRLILEAGIDCRYVDGSTSSGSHAWNIVKLDGKWYNLDATWDLGNYNYNYFLKGSETFDKSHTRYSGYNSDEFNALYPISEKDYPVFASSQAVSAKPTVEKDSDGKWYYYNSNGQKDSSYNGFATNSNGNWYVKNGKVDFSVNSVIKDTTGILGEKGAWYYVVGSKVRTDYTGLANYKNENGWWYIKNGKVDFSHNGVDKNKNGWYYVTGGKVRFDFTGLANYKNKYGWWYIAGGKVDFTRNSVDKNKNGWYYVVGGKVRFDFTGLANYKNKYGWWYINGGKVNFAYSGRARNKNGVWDVKNGKVVF